MYFLKKRNERGAAVVEMAIAFLVLVPLLLCLFFAGEAGALLLESQEEVVSGIWDFSVHPFNMEKTPSWMSSRAQAGQSANVMSRLVHQQYYGAGNSKKNSFVKADESIGSQFQNYDNNTPHFLFCGMKPNSYPGSFFEGRSGSATSMSGGVSVASSGVTALQNKSRGGMVICQSKTRLINKIAPRKYMPGENNKGAVLKHRYALMVDSWGLFEYQSNYRNSKLAYAPDSIFGLSWNSLFPERTHFQNITNEVRNSKKFLDPALRATSMMNEASSSSIATVPAYIDKGDPLRITGVTESIGQPNILGLYMVECSPGVNDSCGASTIYSALSEYERYKYRPTLDGGGFFDIVGLVLGSVTWGLLDGRPKYMTTPLFNEAGIISQIIHFFTGRPLNGINYKEAFSNRGRFYMGKK